LQQDRVSAKLLKWSKMSLPEAFYRARCFITPAWLGRIVLLVLSSGAVCSPFQNTGNAPEVTETQLFKQAQDFTSEGRFEDAARIYQQIVQRDPTSFAALNNLGVIYSHTGDYRRAAEAYERALTVRPHSFPVLMNLGIVYFKGGDYKRAVTPLSQAVSIQPQSFQALALLAISEYSSGDFADARGHLAKAVATQPGNPTLEYMLGESYLRTGQEQKLIDMFQQTVEQTSATDHMLLGTAYDGLGRIDNAIWEFKAAAAISPNALDVHFGLGYLYWKRHDYAQASAEFDREMEDAGWVAESEVYLGDIDVRQERWAAGEALLNQALRLNPRLSLGHLDLGILYGRQKKYREAATEFQTAIQLRPEVAEAYEQLARVYGSEGEAQMERVVAAKAATLHSDEQQGLAQEIDHIPPP
jgi:tetratricopeptide (TPR) repeat protein